MFLLLSGRPIHVARTPAQLHVFACSRAAPPLRSVAPDVPEAIARVVDRLLAFSKDARPESATAARAELAEARATPRRRHARGGGRWPWIVVGVLAIPLGGFTFAPGPSAQAQSSGTEAVTDPPGEAVAPSDDREYADETSPRPALDGSGEVASLPPPAASPSVPPRARGKTGAPARPSRSSAPTAKDAGAPSLREPCEPPYYVDPETGTRRVKPGC